MRVIQGRGVRVLRERSHSDTGETRACREKKTRAIRRRLTPEQANKMTKKMATKAKHFPIRKFAVKA